eukprot:TRINITY_DN2578_c0_g1_i1.p1 TRINITY_DN2578_c0_g1~~TRINITY_DN2578_c0_g1_i1.p1  ORF type:complete len:299 (+),score=113.70 TRINITY_DN2578_c0_g1_i1:85-981(+)
MAIPKACYEDAFDAGPAALIVRLPRTKLKVVRANAAACDLLRMSADDLEKQELQKRVPELATSHLLSLYQEASKGVASSDAVLTAVLENGAVEVSAHSVGGTAVLVQLRPAGPPPTDEAAAQPSLGKRKREAAAHRSTSASEPPLSLDVVTTSVPKAAALFEKLRERPGSVSGDELTSVLLSLVAAGSALPVRAALEYGADPNACSPFTPLYAAVKMGNLEVVKLLLKHGASMVLSNQGQPGECALKLALKMSPHSPIAVVFNRELHEIDRIRAELLEIEKKREGSGGEPVSPYNPRH